MQLPDISMVTPEIIPEKIYSRFWVDEITIVAPHPDADVSARIHLQPFTVIDGAAELSPSGGKWIHLAQLLKRAETDADLAIIIGGLMTYIARVVQTEGVDAPPPAPDLTTPEETAPASFQETPTSPEEE